MTRIILALIISIIASSCSFAGSIETIPLIDRQGESDTSLLINASDSEKEEYFPDGEMPSQILAFYVKVQGQGVLFDAGLQDGNITAGLMKNGINPSDVKTILITHLHPDHFGGLVNFSGKASFLNAVVYVSAPEYDYWVNELKHKPVISALSLYQVHTFQYGDEVLPGIRAVDTSGHTPGHASFFIEEGGEKLIIAGDILHFPEIQMPHPEVSVRYDVDPVKAEQSRRFILDYAAWKDIPIAGMHITPPGIIRVRKSGEGYETY